MTDPLADLARDAAILCPQERAQFAELFLESLAGFSLPAAEAAWVARIRARLAAVRCGEARSILPEDVLAEALRPHRRDRKAVAKLPGWFELPGQRPGHSESAMLP